MIYLTRTVMSPFHFGGRSGDLTQFRARTSTCSIACREHLPMAGGQRFSEILRPFADGQGEDGGLRHTQLWVCDIAARPLIETSADVTRAVKFDTAVAS